LNVRIESVVSTKYFKIQLLIEKNLTYFHKTGKCSKNLFFYLNLVEFA